MKPLLRVLLVLILLLFVVNVWRDRSARSRAVSGPAHVMLDTRPTARDPKFTTSFSTVVTNAAPSVVNIFTSKTIRPDARSEMPFSDLFGHRRRAFRAQSLGSGVIISKEGFILTNNHVVEGADEVNVSLANDTRNYQARVVGTDPQTDLAVIKIDGGDLPALTLADSDKLAVGDVVLAIGNPFGVGQTVTMGIVGAVGRGGLGIVDYEDFIQTDASINPGNSGGALIDTEARLVGVNTAILIPNGGGNQGLGFAIPINMAREVMEAIIKNGKVVRGYLGVVLQDVTPDLARRLKLQQNAGALVAAVAPNSPATDADLRQGDLITEFAGKPVSDSRHLRLLTAQTPPNTQVAVQFQRNGHVQQVHVMLREMPRRQIGRDEEEP
jgi:Do/DeqQ family serine protease